MLFEQIQLIYLRYSYNALHTLQIVSSPAQSCQSGEGIFWI